MQSMVKILLIAGVVCVLGCHSALLQKTCVINVKGSDTMVILMRLWAEEYMKAHQNVSIYTEGGGSAIGFRDLIAGKIDLCTASRPIRAYEVRLLAEKHNRLGMAHLVAKDALSIYVNNANPVRNLQFEQVKAIFTGEIRSWKEVGGYDEHIMLLNRTPNSGTYFYFKEHVMAGMPYAETAHIKHTTSAIVNEVLLHRNAVGYGGIAYGENVIHCRINDVEPSLENVRNDSYPISRYLYFYTIDTPQGELKNFIDWVLSIEGQAIVAKAGYIPLW